MAGNMSPLPPLPPLKLAAYMVCMCFAVSVRRWEHTIHVDKSTHSLTPLSVGYSLSITSRNRGNRSLPGTHTRTHAHTYPSNNIARYVSKLPTYVHHCPPPPPRQHSCLLHPSIRRPIHPSIHPSPGYPSELRLAFDSVATELRDGTFFIMLTVSSGARSACEGTFLMIWTNWSNPISPSCPQSPSNSSLSVSGKSPSSGEKPPLCMGPPPGAPAMWMTWRSSSLEMRPLPSMSKTRNAARQASSWM
mmetsp:Transcript_27764/g.69271  ORF Transcript_27764/g.69271 Transcript_27764/m.69271 type:complete len:247 (-) Transcript_27764:1918-2658(-)